MFIWLAVFLSIEPNIILPLRLRAFQTSGRVVCIWTKFQFNNTKKCNVSKITWFNNKKKVKKMWILELITSNRIVRLYSLHLAQCWNISTRNDWAILFFLWHKHNKLISCLERSIRWWVQATIIAAIQCV